MNEKDLKSLYNNRFKDPQKVQKKSMWSILCNNFFSQYVNSSDIVLDLAAGYCDFINNIQCGEKYAVDLNEDVKKFANNNVNIFLESSTNMKSIKENAIDVVFVSNFFEHLSSKEALFQTLSEIKRVLKKNGKLLILQPNIRFVYREYWDFIDHLLPISDRSLVEALEISGFFVKKMIPQFLPYTTKSRLPQAGFLIKIYLKFPLAWRILGKQCFAVAVKK
ncbi:methyltransferase domain-containing protein [Sebaldella termitidis]|uniref:methyltransferase domain-containing protein n=1 Tax=Sebaldella termitidis TaxID=826 RepID=UPI003EC15487